MLDLLLEIVEDKTYFLISGFHNIFGHPKKNVGKIVRLCLVFEKCNKKCKKKKMERKSGRKEKVEETKK